MTVVGENCGPGVDQEKLPLSEGSYVSACLSLSLGPDGPPYNYRRRRPKSNSNMGLAAELTERVRVEEPAIN